MTPWWPFELREKRKVREGWESALDLGREDCCLLFGIEEKSVCVTSPLTFQTHLVYQIILSPHSKHRQVHWVHNNISNATSVFNFWNPREKPTVYRQLLGCSTTDIDSSYTSPRQQQKVNRSPHGHTPLTTHINLTETHATMKSGNTKNRRNSMERSGLHTHSLCHAQESLLMWKFTLHSPVLGTKVCGRVKHLCLCHVTEHAINIW